MVVSVDDVLKRIPAYADSLELADLMQRLAAQTTGQARTDLLQVACNLQGMWELLQSARHHLVLKALDN